MDGLVGNLVAVDVSGVAQVLGHDVERVDRLVVVATPRAHLLGHGEHGRAVEHEHAPGADVACHGIHLGELADVVGA